MKLPCSWVCVCLISTSEPVDHFSWNLVWTLCHWRPHQYCAFLFSAVYN